MPVPDSPSQQQAATPEKALLGSDPGRPSARELALLGLVIASGLALRAWAIGGVALQHYDEGMFAIAGLAIASTGVPPSWLSKFAPPVFPALLAADFSVVGPSDTSVLALNVTVSTLTILAAWWATRRWFGPAAGVGAATLLALNEFHVALARTGLTDTLFAFLFLVAMVRVHAAFRAPSVRSVLGAGILVGLAWNTKYHGWFVLVVAALALLGDAALRRRWSTAPWVRVLLPATAVASLCFLPWAIFVRAPTGSFSAIVGRYQTFLSLTPIDNLVQYAQELWFFEGPFTRASVPAALLVVVLLSPPRRASRAFVFLVAIAAVLPLAIGGGGAALVLAAAAAPLLARRKVGLAGTLLLAWLGLWVVAAPFYHPYARLLLPLSVAAALAAGAALAWVGAGDGTPQQSRGGHKGISRPVLAGVAAVATWGAAVMLPDAGDPWRLTGEMRDVAASIAAAVPPGEPLAVLGEPALQFYLYGMGRTSSAALEPEGRADGKGTYVAVGWYSAQVPGAADLLSSGVLGTPVSTFRLVPGDIHLLDDYPPQAARRYRQNPDSRYDVRLYRLVR